ncbi:hypothetical protein [Granulicatella elegans]|uniref:hypothetical protein n=1 Tax=Granulicatella elegans TaxID=137732 RepID=UPI000A487D97|nr:hypothetical protein [Granulicatella elegans]UEA31057.1 hypothetical protein LK443_07205 [Granulicatella elegans]
MTKQIVPLNVHQKTQKRKKHTPILKLRIRIFKKLFGKSSEKNDSTSKSNEFV